MRRYQGCLYNIKIGHLSTLLSRIQPAVKLERTTKEAKNSNNPEFVENVARINVKRSVQEILNRSSVLREMVEEGKIGIGGAMYDVSSGHVNFYEDTIIVNQPLEEEVMNA